LLRFAACSFDFDSEGGEAVEEEEAMMKEFQLKGSTLSLALFTDVTNSK